MPTTHKLSKKEVFWSNHVRAWQKSGLSGVTYCDHHALNVKSLYRWVGNVKRRGLERNRSTAAKGKSLIPVMVLPDDEGFVAGTSAPLSRDSAGIRVRVGEKYVVELNIGFDAPSLERLLHALS